MQRKKLDSCGMKRTREIPEAQLRKLPVLPAESKFLERKGTCTAAIPKNTLSKKRTGPQHPGRFSMIIGGNITFYIPAFQPLKPNQTFV
ncbi:hypothetical protein AZ46_0217570 [Metabacillus indicus LMG 22858]|nr:hypothetical protein AZ46_0217570 [Metabacillus indicus LMG 22858]